jgi:8-oxo-dGTP pyrophosphatase MutT (NUDIX family)
VTAGPPGARRAAVRKPATGGKPASWYRQSGAIPVRWKNGGPQVLLVTAGRGKRWVVPKGIVEEHLSPAQSAAKEAWEEAGVTGEVSRRALGRYAYEKWGGVCRVLVYLLPVQVSHRAWPEAGVRRRKWSSPAKAAARVTEPALAALILSVAGLRAAVIRGTTPWRPAAPGKKARRS